MRKFIIVFVTSVTFFIASCKKDTCTLPSGEKFTCEESWGYGSKCSKIELDTFQTVCKLLKGKLSSR